MRRTRKGSVVSSASTKETRSEKATLSIIRTIRQDLRFAVRQLSKSPGFALTAVMVFALGVAASTAIFAFVDAALVRPLPYREPSRLVALFERIPVGDRYHLSYAGYLDWKRLNHVFTSLDVYRPYRFTIKTSSGAEEVSGAQVSDGFFRTLGVAPLLGRDFRPGEDLSTAQQTVILSYETWQKRLLANRNVLGETVMLDGNPSVIIGVLPRGFHFAPVESAGFWATLHWPPNLDPRVGHLYYGVARSPGSPTGTVEDRLGGSPRIRGLLCLLVYKLHQTSLRVTLRTKRQATVQIRGGGQVLMASEFLGFVQFQGGLAPSTEAMAKRMPADVAEAGGFSDWLNVFREHRVWPERTLTLGSRAGEHPIPRGAVRRQLLPLQQRLLCIGRNAHLRPRGLCFEQRNAAGDEALTERDNLAIEVQVLPFQAKPLTSTSTQPPGELDRQTFSRLIQREQLQVFGRCQ
jgi:hypothetical protein